MDAGWMYYMQGWMDVLYAGMDGWMEFREVGNCSYFNITETLTKMA